MKNDTEISDDFEERFAQNAGVNLDPHVLDAVAGEYAHWPTYVKAHPLPDPELIAHFAASVPPTIAWLNHQVYTGATSVLRGAVFGRTAAQHLASLRPGS